MENQKAESSNGITGISHLKMLLSCAYENIHRVFDTLCPCELKLIILTETGKAFLRPSIRRAR